MDLVTQEQEQLGSRQRDALVARGGAVGGVLEPCPRDLER
jgi:hypothetical protein